MISYNINFIFFSIILGILSLIYNNDYSQLYENIHYKSFVELPNNFRTLGELLCEPSTNHIHVNNILREYGNMNEKRYTKNNYPNDDTITKHKITEGSLKENIEITNLNKHQNEKYEKDKEAKSNRSTSSIKYLEMQRKLYNNFYEKPGKDFKNLSDKSKDKSCVCENKKKSWNKVNDKYIGNFKTGCIGGTGMCTVSSAATHIGGVGVGCTFAENVSSSLVIGTSPAVSGGIILPYALATLVLILIAVVLTILYMWLCRKR
ncbi:PIR protein, putative [Plasmodium sp. gorilla clade G3]|nr:PIR protein, putative [Plasmodium sp. gorilla clade G3]